MQRTVYFLYGLGAHALFLGVYLYLVGFVSGVGVPLTLDGPGGVRLYGADLAIAVVVNVLLLAAFGLQHSVMARPEFKRRWTKLVPSVLERSTYVWASNAMMILMFVNWMPIPDLVWDVQQPVLRVLLWVLAGAGWVLVPGASFLINHFDLFGSRQVWLHLKGRPYTQLPFRIPMLYKFVRHPLYVGWLMAFWFTPSMSIGHLLFAGGMTVYILIAVQLEERDLEKSFGRAYADYRQNVPMLLPSLLRPKVKPKPNSDTTMILPS